MFKRFLSDESGATAMEYGLAMALAAIMVVVAMTAVGTSLETGYALVNNQILAAIGAPTVDQPTLASLEAAETKGRKSRKSEN